MEGLCGSYLRGNKPFSSHYLDGNNRIQETRIALLPGTFYNLGKEGFNHLIRISRRDRCLGTSNCHT